jgi:hypothetical protein
MTDKHFSIHDLNKWLPTGGNYREECRECYVVAAIPNAVRPKQCVMRCLCPKVMEDSSVKYFLASIKYRVHKDMVSTKGDGKLFIEDPIA